MKDDYLKLGDWELHGWRATAFSVAVVSSWTIAAISFGYILGITA